MSVEPFYTTQFQAGLGMVSECTAILRLYEAGFTTGQLERKVLESGIFSSCTARRVRNLVAEMFAPRFCRPDGAIAGRLKNLIEHGALPETLRLIYLLHTARAQRVLHDFITQVYWPRQRQGGGFLVRSQAQQFLEEAASNGRMRKAWSTATIRTIASYLLGACGDFGLLGAGRAQRPFQHFRLNTQAALYLAQDLHFAGVGDTSLACHPDWALYGLDHPDLVVGVLQDLGTCGHMLVQAGAGLVQIGWKHPTWTEVLHAVAR